MPAHGETTTGRSVGETPVWCRHAARALLCVVLALVASGGRAAERDASRAGKAGPPTTDWFVLPVAFYLPETSVGFALAAGYHFDTDRGVQTSSVHVTGSYTLRRQASVSVASQLFAGDWIAVAATAGYADFPSHFYGIGERATMAADEAFTSRMAELVVAPEVYLVPRKLRTGPNLALRAERFVAFEPGGQLASGAVPGTDDYAYAGVGWSVAWDTRDSPFAPRRGEHVEASYLWAPVSGARAFGRGRIDARRFLDLGAGHVLGLEGKVEVAHGEVPITMLPRLGGGFGLRGYLDGRWRDLAAYTAQAEWRFPLVRRIGGAAFAGVGAVAPSAGALRASTVRPAGGAGLRVRLTDDGVVLRLDVAVGQDGANGYVVGMQAF